MAKINHPDHKYRISAVTGKRLPSKNTLHRLIKHTEWKLEQLKAQLLEHIEAQ